MDVKLYRMIQRWRVSPGFLPVVVMVAVLTVGSGDVQARLRPVTSPAIITASASDSSATQTTDEQVVPALYVPASTPETAQIQTDMGLIEVGTIDIYPRPAVELLPRDMSGLATSVQQLIASSGASVGVTVVELGGLDPSVLSVNGGGVFTPPGTPKLALFILDARTTPPAANHPPPLD